jgi:phospholipid transport system substrate-binding protein
MKKVTLGLILALSLGANSFAVDCKDPKAFMQTISNDVIKILDNPAYNDNAKQAELTKQFNAYIDSDWMGKFVMGRHWRTLKKPQQDQYLAVYKTFLTKTYVGKFKKYTGKEVIKITDSKQLSAPSEYYVSSIISAPKQEDLNVGYRLKTTGSCFKVTDIVGEGISLINTERQDFNAVMNRKGFDALIQLLNEKIAHGGDDPITKAASNQ